MFWFGVDVIGSLPVIIRRMPVSEWGQERGKEVTERKKERGVLSQYIFLHSFCFVLFKQI